MVRGWSAGGISLWKTNYPKGGMAGLHGTVFEFCYALLISGTVAYLKFGMEYVTYVAYQPIGWYATYVTYSIPNFK